MNGAELLVAALENEGVKQIFGVPGEENLDVVEALRRSSDRAGGDPPRTGGGLHGGDPRTADRRAGRLPDDARSGRAQSDDGRGLRPARRDADGHDHRSEGHPQPQAGALSGRGHRLDHDAADQDGASDRQPGDDPHDRARSVPGRAAGAAGPGASRTAGGHRGGGSARDFAWCRRTRSTLPIAPSGGARSRGRS